MPPRRQLPWASKANINKTPVKRPTVKRAVPEDIDDDFFEGTILERSPKSKRRSVAQLSDDEFPHLPSNLTRTPRDDGESDPGARMLSSSPPPIAADLPPPKTEYMLTGIDKFDLRDDEWMMVEDELLQTAKLFTQHLHLAEYETLKAKMEVQRKIETPRPVVADAKLSFEKQMETKARGQTVHQRKAMKEVLLAQDESSDDEPPPSSPLPMPPPPRAFTSKLVPSVKAGIPPSRAKLWNSANPSSVSKTTSSSKKDGSDSDDLDAPPKPATMKPKSSSKTFDLPPPPPRDQSADKPPESFKPPTTPAHARNKPSRGQRRNLWDDWDELTFDSKTSPPQSAAHSKTPQRTRSPTKPTKAASTPRASSPEKSTHTPTPTRSGPGFSTSIKGSKTGTLDNEVDHPPTNTTLGTGPQDRRDKRNVDKKREDKDKPKYDDIPTFLF